MNPSTQGCVAVPTAPETAFHTLSNAMETLKSAALRAEHLADKLLGGAPPNALGKETPCRAGLFGAVRDGAEDAQRDAQRIHDALGRIEASIP